MTRRWVPLAVLLAAGVGLAGIAYSATEDGLTYYRTPSEVADDPSPAGSVRLGGMVVPGSISQSPAGSELLLTDGVTDVQVAYPERLPAVLREGEGAVVEGRLDGNGVLHASELLLRHSNEYQRAP